MLDHAEVLGRVPLFSAVSKKDLRALAEAAREMTYEAGKVLTSQDDLGVTFFVVLEGEAQVTVGGQPRRRLGAGDHFGEMSMIDRAPRSADVEAITQLTCLVFSQWTFRPFLKEQPDVAWALLEALAARVRELEARD